MQIRTRFTPAPDAEPTIIATNLTQTAPARPVAPDGC